MWLMIVGLAVVAVTHTARLDVLARLVRPTLLAAVLLPWPRQAAGAQAAAAAPDAFAFLRPTVIVTQAERQQLARGEPVARVLPAPGREVTVFAAVRVAIDPDRLLDWVRAMPRFKQSRYVQAIARFSDPPRVEDLAALALDDGDLEAMRDCQPGACGVKLSAAEMDRLRRAAADAGAAWKPALTQAFREVVLGRVQAYATGGHAALEPIADRRQPYALDARFASLLEHTAFLTQGLAPFAEALARHPASNPAAVESFLYWSKEGVSGKPIVSVTHTAIARYDDAARPEVLVAGKGVFATHYVTASLGLTALVRDADGSRYLVYMNRSEVDVLGGVFGGLARTFMERRLKSESAEILRGLRTRLEGGPPS
jgi:hypothetical protein